MSDLRASYESLLQLLYRSPLALLQTALDGQIELMTPRAAALLMPLCPTAGLDNLLTLLEPRAPGLARARAALAGQPGVLLDGQLLAVPGPHGVQNLAVVLIRIEGASAGHPGHLLCLLHDLDRPDEAPPPRLPGLGLLSCAGPTAPLVWSPAARALLGLAPMGTATGSAGASAPRAGAPAAGWEPALREWVIHAFVHRGPEGPPPWRCTVPDGAGGRRRLCLRAQSREGLGPDVALAAMLWDETDTPVDHPQADSPLLSLLTRTEWELLGEWPTWRAAPDESPVPGLSPSGGGYLNPGNHLLSLVNAVIDIGRIGAGAFELSLLPNAYGPCLRGALQDCRAAARAAGVRLGLSPMPSDADLPVLHIAAPRLQQLLGHLLRLALMHSLRGGHVSVRTRPLDGGQLIEIVDRGRPMSSTMLAGLFSPEGHRGPVGHTIGLMISHELVAAMGGMLTLERVADTGNRWSVWLPRPARAAIQRRRG